MRRRRASRRRRSGAERRPPHPREFHRVPTTARPSRWPSSTWTCAPQGASVQAPRVEPPLRSQNVSSIRLFVPPGAIVRLAERIAWPGSRGAIAAAPSASPLLRAPARRPRGTDGHMRAPGSRGPPGRSGTWGGATRHEPVLYASGPRQLPLRRSFLLRLAVCATMLRGSSSTEAEHSSNAGVDSLLFKGFASERSANLLLRDSDLLSPCISHQALRHPRRPCVYPLHS